MSPQDQELIKQIQAKRAEQLAVLLNLGLQVLSTRALALIALLLESGIFAWAVYQGGWDRIAAATLFAIGAWFLVNFRPHKGE